MADQPKFRGGLINRGAEVEDRVDWLTEEQVLERVGISRAELEWFGQQFGEQMRQLTDQRPAAVRRYAPDVVTMLQGLTAMVAQGATPAQIKTWFGLAAGWQR